MELKKFAFKEEELGEYSKKAFVELVQSGDLVKTEEGYEWTEKGIIENQKLGLRGFYRFLVE